MEKMENILQRLPEKLDTEAFQDILTGREFRMERIVSKGHASPEDEWFDQEWSEWVMVLRGRAGLKFSGQKGIVQMGPGDYINIPARCRHRVAWTDPEEETVWLALHYR